MRRGMLAVVLSTMLAALLVNALVLLYFNAEDYRRTQVAEVRTQAEIVGRASAAALAVGDQREAQRDVSMLDSRGDLEAAALYGSDGSLFAAFRRERSAQIPLSAQPPGFRIAGGRLSVFHPIVEKGDTIGMVYVQTRYGLRDRMLAYLGIVALVSLGALAVALLLSAWLQRALRRPILEVSDATRSSALEATNESLQRELLKRARAEEALRAADRRKDEFLNTLAHELRNPLAPIRNALYVMQTARGDPEATAGAREMIERQLHQMVRLVDDLLDVSRIAIGKLALRRERVELRSVAQNALEAIEPMMRSRGHELIANMPPAGVYVNADPTRLAQVFVNLLNNAAKFSEPGGRIEFGAMVAGGELVASVRDSGIGFAPEMRETIFEMFARADRSLERSAMGLGVGLSLSRRLVELHGGTIEAKSDGPGRGAEFIVRIPMLQQLHGASMRSSVRHRVLVTDDSQDFAESLAMLLRSMGHEVRIEHDGAAALAAAAELRPQYAFLDIGLPKLNGFDLARRLRAEYPGAILVAVTGWGDDADRQRATDAGFDHYLVKPVDVERLQEIVRG